MRDKAVKKERLDLLLVSLNLASDLKEATALIMAGRVFVNGQKALYPSEKYSPVVSEISVAPGGGGRKYVSRGGLKLEGALRDFGIDAAGKICLDIGSSTGGFTDVLLRNGADRVYAFDVGKNLIHEKIASDKRVVVVENFNFKYFPSVIKDKNTNGNFHYYCYEAARGASLAVCDVSFISVMKILRALSEGLDVVWSELTTLVRKHRRCDIVALIKPQFELPPRYLKKGVVWDSKIALAAAEEIASQSSRLNGVTVRALVPSRVKGAAGNEEFFLHLVKEA